jgi:PPOX class probable F420-dependent enzyme
MDAEACWAHLRRARSGVLGTVHPERGVDAVPVVYAVDDDRRIVVPVDAVKAKGRARLQRLVNVERDPRVVLLVDEYDDDDWSRLWWVRVHGRAGEQGATPALVEFLAARYRQYRTPGAVVGALVITPEAVAGWRSGEPR